MTEEAYPSIPENFMALTPERGSLEGARVVILPVPYDSTTTFRAGAREGPRAIIDASANIEEYDPEVDAEVTAVGIHTASPVEPHLGSPERMADRVEQAVSSLWAPGRILGMLGGEHSITIGSVRAMRSHYEDLSVLYVDAHGDLRDEYHGTRYGHANAARRVSEMCPLAVVGVRAISQEEVDFARNKRIPLYIRQPGRVTDPREVVSHLSKNVYISIDLDVLDLGIMSAVGNPEPGGMGWDEALALIRAVATTRNIVGFDAVELAPREGPAACSYTAAKLVYKVIAYATAYGPK